MSQIIMLVLMVLISANNPVKEISKNKMQVKWRYDSDFIQFDVAAPTKGWIAIGFNEDENISGAYLLMGRIIEGKPEVIEHFTERPGYYQPIQNYGINNRVTKISGTENENVTRIKFSIPVTGSRKYHKSLLPGDQWTLIMAYSTNDDFQHHSIMRTTARIQL